MAVSDRKIFSEEHQASLEARTGMEVGDLVLFCADKPGIVHDTLGNLRKEIARQRGLIPENEFRFVWVTDFPLFEYSETRKALCFKRFWIDGLVIIMAFDDLILRFHIEGCVPKRIKPKLS